MANPIYSDILDVNDSGHFDVPDTHIIKKSIKEQDTQIALPPTEEGVFYIVDRSNLFAAFEEIEGCGEQGNCSEINGRTLQTSFSVSRPLAQTLNDQKLDQVTLENIDVFLRQIEGWNTDGETKIDCMSRLIAALFLDPSSMQEKKKWLADHTGENPSENFVASVQVVKERLEVARDPEVPNEQLSHVIEIFDVFLVMAELSQYIHQVEESSLDPDGFMRDINMADLDGMTFFTTRGFYVPKAITYEDRDVYAAYLKLVEKHVVLHYYFKFGMFEFFETPERLINTRVVISAEENPESGQIEKPRVELRKSLDGAFMPSIRKAFLDGLEGPKEWAEKVFDEGVMKLPETEAHPLYQVFGNVFLTLDTDSTNLSGALTGLVVWEEGVEEGDKTPEATWQRLLGEVETYPVIALKKMSLYVTYEAMGRVNDYEQLSREDWCALYALGPRPGTPQEVIDAFNNSARNWVFGINPSFLNTDGNPEGAETKKEPIEEYIDLIHELHSQDEGGISDEVFLAHREYIKKLIYLQGLMLLGQETTDDGMLASLSTVSLALQNLYRGDEAAYREAFVLFEEFKVDEIIDETGLDVGNINAEWLFDLREQADEMREDIKFTALYTQNQQILEATGDLKDDLQTIQDGITTLIDGQRQILDQADEQLGEFNFKNLAASTGRTVVRAVIDKRVDAITDLADELIIGISQSITFDGDIKDGLVQLGENCADFAFAQMRAILERLMANNQEMREIFGPFIEMIEDGDVSVDELRTLLNTIKTENPALLDLLSVDLPELEALIDEIEFYRGIVDDILGIIGTVTALVDAFESYARDIERVGKAIADRPTNIVALWQSNKETLMQHEASIQGLLDTLETQISEFSEGIEGRYANSPVVTILNEVAASVGKTKEVLEVLSFTKLNEMINKLARKLAEHLSWVNRGFIDLNYGEYGFQTGLALEQELWNFLRLGGTTYFDTSHTLGFEGHVCLSAKANDLTFDGCAGVGGPFRAAPGEKAHKLVPQDPYGFASFLVGMRGLGRLGVTYSRDFGIVGDYPPSNRLSIVFMVAPIPTKGKKIEEEEPVLTIQAPDDE